MPTPTDYLVGNDITVTINGAGAHFRDFEFQEDIEEIDVTPAKANVMRRKPDWTTRRATITCHGLVPNGTSGSFFQACEIGAEVFVADITATGLNAGLPTGAASRLAPYGSFLVSACQLSHRQSAESTDVVILQSSGNVTTP